MSLSAFIIQKIKKKRGMDMLSSARIRAYARTMDAGFRMIEEVQEDYRVAVYIELIARYDWSIEEVDERYISQVKAELDISK